MTSPTSENGKSRRAIDVVKALSNFSGGLRLPRVIQAMSLATPPNGTGGRDGKPTSASLPSMFAIVPQPHAAHASTAPRPINAAGCRIAGSPAEKRLMLCDFRAETYSEMWERSNGSLMTWLCLAGELARRVLATVSGEQDRWLNAAQPLQNRAQIGRQRHLPVRRCLGDRRDEAEFRGVPGLARSTAVIRDRAAVGPAIVNLLAADRMP